MANKKKNQASVETEVGCGLSAERQQADNLEVFETSCIRRTARCNMRTRKVFRYAASGPCAFRLLSARSDLQGSTIHTRATLHLPELQHRKQRLDRIVT